MKWIDEIAAEFVWDLFKKSEQNTNYKKAEEVYKFVTSKSPEELAEIMNISEKDWNLGCAWKETMNCAYRLLWKYYQIF